MARSKILKVSEPSMVTPVLGNDDQCQFDFFNNIPDEIIVKIIQDLDPYSRRALRCVSVRFRSLVFSQISRIDYKIILAEPGLKNDQRIFQFIRKCPNLKYLSLITLNKKAPTDPLLASLVKNVKQVNKVAKDLAKCCPNLQCIEVSGIATLRVVREYSRRLYAKGRCNLQEIRFYSIQDFNTLYTVMRAVNRFCPKLNTFKLLQRKRIDKGKRNVKVAFENLWIEMSPKLTKFSTNIEQAQIVSYAVSSLTNLERIVVWGLKMESLDLLSQSLVYLRILILMSVDLTGIHFISRLKNLTEFHIKVQPGFKSPTGNEALTLRSDFQHLFSEIGSNFQKLSFNFRNSSTCHLLDTIPQYCKSLTELRFSECTDRNHLFSLAANVEKLESFHWEGDQDKTTPETAKSVAELCTNLVRARPTLKRVIGYNYVYLSVKNEDSK